MSVGVVVALWVLVSVLISLIVTGGCIGCGGGCGGGYWWTLDGVGLGVWPHPRDCAVRGRSATSARAGRYSVRGHGGRRGDERP